MARNNNRKTLAPPRYVDVYSYGVPSDDVEFLRPFAARDGRSAKSVGGIGRWAIVNLAQRLRDEQRKGKTA